MNRVKNLLAGLSPSQAISMGLLLYILLGFLYLSLPFSQLKPIDAIDNLFTVVSAISTTGLTTITVPEVYSFWGQVGLVVMFQVGGWGFMTVTSFFFLVTRGELSEHNQGILRSSYSLPEGFDIKRFILSTVVFTVVIELLGTAILFWFLEDQDLGQRAWSSFFHTVSAFATAGFSVYGNSLVDYRDNIGVNLTVGILCYLGAIGFIVLQDFYLALRKRRKITLTSRIILTMTAAIFIAGTALIFLFDSTLQQLPIGSRLISSAFQTMSASSTAGFNTIDLGMVSRSTMLIVVVIMLVGASPSGTGGGIKTTSVSALWGVVKGVVLHRKAMIVFKREIPLHRVLHAVAVTAVYFSLMGLGTILILLLCPVQLDQAIFEVVSALGTVGLSMGITSSLGLTGKCVIILLMFVGRVGPISIGSALFSQNGGRLSRSPKSDLAT